MLSGTKRSRSEQDQVGPIAPPFPTPWLVNLTEYLPRDQQLLLALINQQLNQFYSPLLHGIDEHAFWSKRFEKHYPDCFRETRGELLSRQDRRYYYFKFQLEENKIYYVRNKKWNAFNKELLRCLRLNDLTALKQLTFNIYSVTQFLKNAYQLSTLLQYASELARMFDDNGILQFLYFQIKRFSDAGRLPFETLIYAAACGETDEFTTLLNKIIFDGKFREKFTLIISEAAYAACWNGHLALVRKCITMLLECEKKITKEELDECFKTMLICSMTSNVPDVTHELNKICQNRHLFNDPTLLPDCFKYAITHNRWHGFEILLPPEAVHHLKVENAFKMLLNAATQDLALKVREILSYCAMSKNPLTLDDVKEALLTSAKDGHFDVIEEILTALPPHTPLGELGLEMLHLSIIYKHIGLFYLLLKYGVDVNIRFKGKYPLILAAEAPDDLMVKELLKAGASANIPFTEKFKHPLWLAIENNRPTMVECLLAAGADIHKEMTYEKRTFRERRKMVKEKITFGTPIQFAIRKKAWRIVKMLKNQGADINACKSSGISPLGSALLLKNYEKAAYLLFCGADLPREAEIKEILLWMVDNLFENKKLTEFMPIDSHFANGDTLLTLCLRFNIPTNQIKKLIIIHKANVNTATLNGESPLEIAFQKENADAWSMLVDAGADIDHVNSEQETYVFRAVQTRSVNFFTHILPSLKNHIHTPNRYGFSPLVLACTNNDPDKVRAILAIDNHVDIPNQLGDTPAMVLLKSGAGAHCHHLFSTGKVDLFYRNPSQENVITLLDNPTNLAARAQLLNVTYQGERLLLDALNKREYVELSLILSWGVNPDGHPLSKSTSPLKTAVMLRDITAVRLLLMAGANPNKRKVISTLFRNELSCLCQATENGDEEIVGLLLEAGAIVDEGPIKESALTIARRKGNQSIINLIQLFEIKQLCLGNQTVNKAILIGKILSVISNSEQTQWGSLFSPAQPEIPFLLHRRLAELSPTDQHDNHIILEILHDYTPFIPRDVLSFIHQHVLFTGQIQGVTSPQPLGFCKG